MFIIYKGAIFIGGGELVCKVNVYISHTCVKIYCIYLWCKKKTWGSISGQIKFLKPHFDLRLTSYTCMNLKISMDLYVTQEWRCGSRMSGSNQFNSVHRVQKQRHVLFIPLTISCNIARCNIKIANVSFYD